MDHSRPHEGRRVLRRPLTDATARINNASPIRDSGRADAFSAPKLVHHESLQANGDPRALGRQCSPSPSPGYARVSVVASEAQQESNRNSQISTTSTNASGKSRRKTHIGPWRLGKTLGRGSTARVRLAKHAVTGQFAAVKIVSKAAAVDVMRRSNSLRDRALQLEAGSGEDQQMPFGIEREVVIMKLIEHQNVISLYDVWENRGELYLVMEYVDNGELFTHILREGCLPEVEAMRYFRQLISGLAYCHAFNICHRDLKPENILLDKNRNIKIADFGMAALQPLNRLLYTSCGSPHYAAPEIIKGKQYSGDKVDIWSCGVILFVTLTASHPFDDDDIQKLLQKITKGRFKMPEHLSADAKDLLWKMLQVDPARRINLEQIWHHPLVRRYEIVRHIDGSLERIGGPPQIPLARNLVRPRHRGEIDREILRNLHTLWHGEVEEVLIERLLNNEDNQEKLFYCLLLKYREDRLEDFQGLGIEYSASDHHYTKPPPRGPPRPRYISSIRRLSRRSRFSIVGGTNSNLRSSPYGGSQAASPPESYDPFRSSRNQMQEPAPNSATITVHRAVSKRSIAASGSARHPAVARLTQAQTPRTPSSVVSASQGYASSRKTGSRYSLASTGYRSSPPIVMRPSSSHKRGVAFNHTRRPSAASSLIHVRDGATSRNEDRADHSYRYSSPASPATASDRAHSPNAPELPYPKPRRETVKRARSPQWAEEAEDGRTQSHFFKEEARKVSTELGRLCEEVFNRSSISIYDGEPSSSVASREPWAQGVRTSPVSARDRAADREKLRILLEERPLPRTPSRPYDAYTEEQLRTTRDKLKRRSVEGRAGPSQGYLEEVIAHLDRLMQPSTSPREDYRRRIASADYPSQYLLDSRLPAITEEGRLSAGHRYQNEVMMAHHGHRSASAPLQHGPHTPSRRRQDDSRDIIRMVERDAFADMSPVAPLNVRKKSDRTVREPYERGGPSAVQEYGMMSPTRPRGDVFRGPAPGMDMAPVHDGGAADEQSGKSKRFGWFKRNGGASAKDDRRRGSDDKESSRANETTSTTAEANHEVVGVEDDETRKRKGSGSGKRAFFGMFSRRESGKGVPELRLGTPEMDEEEGGSMSTSVASGVKIGFRRGEERRTSKASSWGGGQGSTQRNWLARFLHIKPASKTICLTTSKTRARREIASILREWRRYGLKDLVVDKQRNVVFGRVDAENSLHIKPVSFVCEIHTVIEHGRRAGGGATGGGGGGAGGAMPLGTRLAIAHFRQDHGAASSFQRVVQTLEKMLKKRDLLVMDRKKRRAMQKILIG